MPGKEERIIFRGSVNPSLFCFGTLVYDRYGIHKARLPKHDLKDFAS